MYFEPTLKHEYWQPVTQPAWGGVVCGTVQNRGVQNVPSMSTVGVQYSVDQTGSRVPTGTLPAGSGAPSFYHTPSSAYTLPYGPQPAAITGEATYPTVAGVEGVVGGQPVVVSGSSCPLCGRPDYHVHSDAALVNGTHSVVSAAASLTAASNNTVPVAVSSGLTTFLARCEHSSLNSNKLILRKF